MANKENDLKPSFSYRLASAYQMIVKGKTPDWFGPGSPIDPIAPDAIKGRQLDFPTGVNTIAYAPKANEGVPFWRLRTLADSLDVMRLVIESFKDQFCKLDWQITKDGDVHTKPKRDRKCDELEDLLALPDGEHDWEDWLRMVLEEVIVVDALTLYPVRINGKQRFQVIDGTTIKRVVDDKGRTPTYPGVPAYQQILKGVPANDYTFDELIYKPRNLRAWKIYGYSPIEQTIVTITMALWRQASQLQYYTDGSTPDLIMSVPADWTVEQIGKFKAWWDALLLGNTAERRGTMFVPEGTKPYETKDKVLTDKMEEWISRVLCLALRISPQPFVSTFNRATAESAKEQAKEDGVGSTMIWVRRFMNRLLAQYIGAEGYVFRWKEEDETDPHTKAQVNDIKVRNGSKTINEARAEDGEDPIEGGDTSLIYLPSGVVRLEDVVNGAPTAVQSPDPTQVGAATPPAQTAPTPQKAAPQNTGQKLAKVTPSGPNVVRLRAAAGATLGKLRQSIQAQLEDSLNLGKADLPDVLKSLDVSELDNLLDALESALAQANHEGWSSGMIAVHAPDQAAMLNPNAAAWAAKHAGERIAQLGDSTREFLRTLVADAVAGDWTSEQLATALGTNYAFSDLRAKTIADTELATALEHGSLAAWREIGIAGKSWSVSPDENNCGVCLANQAQGVIPIDELFQSGDQAPTAHPNCHCDLIPHRTLED